jgi:RHS repeat-associated protein
MFRTYRAILPLLVIIVAFPFAASAQVATGTPPFGSFGGGPDIINLANLNAHWTIPALNKPGRGTNFTYDLSYDTSLWYPVTAGSTTSWQPVYNWGWRGATEVATGYVSYSAVPASCRYFDPIRKVYWTVYYENYSNYVYHDAYGRFHPYTFTTSQGQPNCHIAAYGATGVATDGSGLTMTVPIPGNSTTATVTTTAGTVFNPPMSFGTGSGNFTDRNGNEVTADGTGKIYDTLSSTTPVLTVTGTGTPTDPMVFTYAAASGASAAYTMKYTTYTVQTNFGCGIVEYPATSNSLVSEIDLPDYNPSTNPNSKYTFAYEQTPGVPANVTGRLKSVTLPTGGTITYNYTGGNNGIICADGSAATLTRTTPDGTWTYAQVKNAGAASTTTVTDPQSNQTVIQFQGIYETERDAYQGSSPGTLLLRTNTCYNGSTSPCNGTAFTLPITRRTETIQLGGLQCKHDRFWNSFGMLTEADDYDYASGGPGLLLKKTLITYASLGSNLNAFTQTVTTCNGTGSSPSCNNSGTVVAQTNYNYDETTPAATSGIAQHASVSGSRGNLTSINYPVSGLTAHFTYWDTGSPNTQQDVNGATTTFNYSSTNNAYCQMAFPTSVSEPLSLSRSMTWNCTGGVLTSVTDENSKTTTTTYANDPYYWRPDSVTDPTGAAVSFCYGLLSSSTGTCTRNPTQVESTLNFNSNNSSADSLMTVDGLGRPILQQTRQAPSSGNFDSAETAYDSLGRLYWTTLPYSGTAGQTNSSAPSVNNHYDALGRITSTAYVPGGGSVSYSYTNNDVLVTIGPAPSGENTKQRQLEYDSLGRLTSVCELTSAAGSGSCGQNTAQTGYWTKYAYDALGNLTGVTQNAQPGGAAQTRSYSFDGLSRLTSETNPESGTTTYTYDSATGCTGTFSGDLVKRVDAAGNVTCSTFDALHRVTSINYPSGPNMSVTAMKMFYYDAPYPPQAQPASNTLGRLASAGTCQNPTCAGNWITFEDFSYSARGELTDVYEWTANSGGWYHVAQSYWASGAPSQLSGSIGLPTVSYGVDGEGRTSAVSASSGQNPVTGVTFNAGSLPTQVNFGSGDTDIFAYDSNTLRMTQFKFNVGAQPQTYIGAATWNANSTLGQLAITDPFNGADTQTCTYAHDDLTRIAGANCGAAAAQTFSYDPFGNISKSGSPYSFQPTYSAATNRMTSLPGFTPTYDANGNLLNDNSHAYTWDADGNSVTVDGVALTYDALDRMVEQNRSGSYTQIVYAPTGGKLALMSGQSLVKAFIPLPGQATAVYTSSGLDHYRHSDWLGSARLTSSPTRTVLSTTAYAPFGETYAQSGSADLSFTGQNSDTVSGDYDFLFREYSMQGRWASPDPAGLGAVDPTNPQSWNRYAYVLNNPTNLVDPLGLDDCLGGEHMNCVSDWFGPGGGGFGMDLWGGGDPLGCRADDFWGGDCVVENRMFLRAIGVVSSFDIAELANIAYLVYPIVDGRLCMWCPPKVIYPFAGLQSFLWYDSTGRGGANGSGGGESNPAIGQSILKGIAYQLRYAVGSLAKQGACGNTPEDALLKSVKSGAVRGTVRGAAAGFGGGEFFGGIGGVPGAILGAFVGGTFGAAGGVIWGGARAGACSLAGVYGQ